MIDYLEPLVAGRADALEQTQRQLYAALAGNLSARPGKQGPQSDQGDEGAAREDSGQPQKDGRTGEAKPENLTAAETQGGRTPIEAIFGDVIPLSAEEEMPEQPLLPLLEQVLAMERSAGLREIRLDEAQRRQGNAQDDETSVWQAGGRYPAEFELGHVPSAGQRGINGPRVSGRSWPQDLAAWKKTGVPTFNEQPGQESGATQRDLRDSTSAWVEEHDRTQKLDQAVRRDSRRYDGGFFLY